MKRLLARLFGRRAQGGRVLFSLTHVPNNVMHLYHGFEWGGKTHVLDGSPVLFTNSNKGIVYSVSTAVMERAMRCPMDPEDIVAEAYTLLNN